MATEHRGVAVKARSLTQRRAPRLRPAAVRSGTQWQAVGVAAAVAAAAALIFALWMTYQIGGSRTTSAVDDIGEAVAALVAAASCAVAAVRSKARLRVAWSLLSLSAASWGAGEVAWSVMADGFGIANPFPSVADVGFVISIPLAMAGILAFSTQPRGSSARWRLVLDGAVVAFSLLFVGWDLGLAAVWRDPNLPALEKALSLAYPTGDILVGTLLILAIRRSFGQQQGRMLLILGGLAANSIADSAFAYLNANGNNGVTVLDTGWVIGYLMIALGAMWPSSPDDDAVKEAGPIDMWQLVLPWTAVLGAGITTVGLGVAGVTLDRFSMLIAGALVVLLMATQVLAYRRSLSLLIASRLSEATLRDVIAHAPIGIARIGSDSTVLGANPVFARMLGSSPDEVVGTSVDKHFSTHELSTLLRRTATFGQPSIDGIESDSMVNGPNGGSVWLHWNATSVNRPDGRLDYYVVMFQDVTARRAVEARAAETLAELQSASKAKSDFLTLIRQEFRTALVGIQGFSELIHDEQLSRDELREMADDIRQDALRMDRLFNRILFDEQPSTSKPTRSWEID